jgi:hypothetical protein
MVPDETLVSMQRSAAMLSPGQTISVDGSLMYDLTAELLEHRQLIARLGADLRTVAGKAAGPPRRVSGPGRSST